MLIYRILHLWAHVDAANAAYQRAGYEAAPAPVKAALTRARTAMAAELSATWPEYGRKVNTGWWAGPEYVQPERDPSVVASVSLGCGSYRANADGSTSTVSGSTCPDLYQDGPIGMIIIDKRANPEAVYSAPLLDVRAMAGRVSYPDCAPWQDDPISLARVSVAEWIDRVRTLAASPLTVTPAEHASALHPDDWTTGEDYRGEPERRRGPLWSAAYEAHRSAGAPGGMSSVGLTWYAAYWLRHGASVGYRSARDTVTWIGGPRAGEVETFTPAPFYPDNEQPPAARGLPEWAPVAQP